MLILCCREFPMGTQIEDQQVGCLWQGSYLLSVSLSGYINYLDVNNPAKPLRVLKVRLSVRVFSGHVSVIVAKLTADRI